jgi:very-short-patch-repair endonuclease
MRLGFRPDAIGHRVAKGRLHPVARGVYAVGRPQLCRHGRWISAVLSCGVQAALSHRSAAALWGILETDHGQIEVSVRLPSDPRPPRITVHRRATLVSSDFTRRHGVPVTTPICTLVDLAAQLPDDLLEAAVNEADKRDLASPEALRAALAEAKQRPGVGVLKKMLDRRTFTLTDSHLERLMLPLIRSAGLPRPQTRCLVNRFRVDFYWPTLQLVVETDGLRYHRTPAQQTRDRVRDQTHAAAGLTTLRFTHSQVAFDAGHVVETLMAVADRLQGR